MRQMNPSEDSFLFMRTIFYSILLFILPAITFSQNKKAVTIKQKPAASKILSDDTDKIFEKVEPGAAPVDPSAWNKYIQKNAVLPDFIARQIPTGTYEVLVNFIVDKYGYIGQVQSVNDPGFGLAERAVKIIRNYSVAWRPASQCGRTVNSYRQQTIVFEIKD